MTSLTLAFAGTPAFGLPCLDALYASKHDLKAIYTQPDRPAGRGRQLQASAVKTWGEAHGLPVHQPLHFKDLDAQETLAELQLDVLVVIAYGLILPSAILALPRLGCINVHASLLPRWRGASPIQHALLHGDAKTGITIMQMDKGMDTGAILTSEAIPILPNDTSERLHDKLAHLAPKSLIQTLDALAAHQATPTPQDGTHATYAPKISKEDAHIQWHHSASSLDQHVRAYNPWPIAHTRIRDTTLRVHQAQWIDAVSTAMPGTILSIDAQGILVSTGAGALRLTIIQFPGSKAMPVADWLHAGRRQLDVGMVFS